MRIPRIKINTPEDYSDWATDVLSEMTDSLMGDKRYIIPIEESDFDPEELDENWSYVFTPKGKQMIDNWHSHLHFLGLKLFPDVEDFEIQNWYCEES